MNAELTQVFELTLSEKLQLVEDFWDSIAKAPEQIPVLDWHKEELAQRKAAYLQKNEFVTDSMVLRNLIILPEAEQNVT